MAPRGWVLGPTSQLGTKRGNEEALGQDGTAWTGPDTIDPLSYQSRTDRFFWETLSDAQENPPNFYQCPTPTVKTHQHLLVAVDEFGSTAGVVTMEDVMEHILGREIFEKDDVAVDMRGLARAKLQKQRRARRPGDPGSGLWSSPREALSRMEANIAVFIRGHDSIR